MVAAAVLACTCGGCSGSAPPVTVTGGAHAADRTLPTLGHLDPGPGLPGPGLPGPVPGSAPGPVPGPTPVSTGRTAAENARPGTVLHLPVDGPWPVSGYLDADSAADGDVVGAHLACTRGRAEVRLAAYRIGWYGGAGARLVWTSAPVALVPRPVPGGGGLPHLITPTWPVSVDLRIDGSWTPGFYLLLAQDARGRALSAAVPLVVRDPAGTEPILVKADSLTWNAYGDWAGWSLYHGPVGTHAQQAADRARVVSLQRPLTGSGYHQLLAMDLPVVREVERLGAARGIDAGYTTDVAVDADPAQLLHHAVVVSGGHSEYWTTRMYDGLLSAADAGVNLAFLGANNLWWHTRLEGGTPGRPAREVVYRVLAEDPAARQDPAEATVQWQTQGRDPAAVLGQSHAAIDVHGGLRLYHPPSWFVVGTGLADGAVLPLAVGNEADGFNPRGHNPPDTQVLAAGVLDGRGGPVLVTSSYSTRPSGAAVFAAGSTDWACALSPACPDAPIPAATTRAVTQLTDNVLVALAVPRAGLAHPATSTGPLTAAGLSAWAGPAATGTYGVTDADESAPRPGRAAPAGRR